MRELISPHGNTLIDLLVSGQKAEELKRQVVDWPSWSLTPRQLCDLELLQNGAFSPLTGFMDQADYRSVCQDMRLADGTLWPIPIVLDVTETTVRAIEPSGHLVLRDPEGVALAVLQVSDVFRPDRNEEAGRVYGSLRTEHPGVAHLLSRTHDWHVGGRIFGLQMPHHYDFKELRHMPSELRAEIQHRRFSRVVAFQTRNPMHRAHLELTLLAAEQHEAALLIHPVVGQTKPGDVDHYTRVRCYQALMPHYPDSRALLSLLPLAMRMAGPREALWHAIIRKNCGCTHLIVGRDHAGPGVDSAGQAFYEPYAAQALLAEYETELGMVMVPFQQMVYVPAKDTYSPVGEVPDGMETKAISGTALRQMLQDGQPVPGWFSFPAVLDELKRSVPPKGRRGLVVFFTGLPSSGKSTVAKLVMVRMLERSGRPVSLLDGDLVRKNLSSELGFSKKDRDTNIRRIGWVAAEIAKHRGIAICAPIAPYDAIRKEVRAMVGEQGAFVLVHVDTPLAVCEQRDRKGLYKKARAGVIAEFTGISDPYEAPADAELRLDTTAQSPEACAEMVLNHLTEQGLF